MDSETILEAAELGGYSIDQKDLTPCDHSHSNAELQLKNEQLPDKIQKTCHDSSLHFKSEIKYTKIEWLCNLCSGRIL